VDIPVPNDTEKPPRANKGTLATVVEKHLSGDSLMLKNSENNIGLSCGLPRATASDNYVNTRVTAGLNFSKSKTIGSRNYPINSVTMLSANI